jgi:glutathione S-transferase
MLELYTHPMSPCAQKVRIVLAEKGLDWIPHAVDLSQKENLRPEYLKLNPLGVVPTLVHDGRPVIESSIICEYLDEAFPDPGLKPPTAHQRAGMRLWMKHVDIKLHPACGTLQWPLVMRQALMAKAEAEREALLARIPEKARRERQQRLVRLGLDAPEVVDAVHVYRRTIRDMEGALAGQAWMAGAHFSLADVCLAPYFQTIHQFGWQPMFEDCPRVSDWFERCRARESYLGSVSCDFPPPVAQDLLARGERAWPTIRAHLASFG